MSQPSIQPFTLNMTPGSRIRMDKYYVGPEGIQINCGTPVEAGRSETKLIDKGHILMKFGLGGHMMIQGAQLAGQKKIDLVCKTKP